MFNILSFLQGGWLLFEKGGTEKAEGQFTKRRDKTPCETMSYVTRVI